MTDKPSLEVIFTYEKETLNTIRYQEVVDPGKQPMVGVFYLKKGAAMRLTNPSSLVITITPGD